MGSFLRKPRRHHRPFLERLERRLPPGSLFNSLLLGESELMLEMDRDNLDASVSQWQMIDDKGDGGATLSLSVVGGGAASDSVEVRGPVRRSEESTTELTNPETYSQRSRIAPSRLALNLSSVAAMATGRLAAPMPGLAARSMMPGAMPLDAPAIAAGGSAANAPSNQAPSATQESEMVDNYGKLPVSFEQNIGQFDERVDFVARGSGSTLFLTPSAAVFAMQNSESRIQNSELAAHMARVDASARRDLRALTQPGSPEATTGVAVHMQIVGGNPQAQATATDQLPGITNYFIGNDPNEWHTNIASFGRVEYDEVYPGIDLAYYGNNGKLEYDFIVSPGVDPSAIGLDFAGADGMEINTQGDLVIHTAVGDVVQQKPFTYQDVSGSRQEVASGYVMDGNTVHFEVENYDQSLPIVIDPVVGIEYSTFLGGTGADSGNAIALDASGNAYVTGSTTSANFPTTAGVFDLTFNGVGDAFVTKLNATGSGLVYSTYFGGSADDYGIDISLDSSNNAYVTGSTSSTNFPSSVGAFDTTFNGVEDAFVTKLNASGSAVTYSTFLGGAGNDYGHGISVDSGGVAHLTGAASSTFPTTPGALDTTYNGLTWDVFVSKLNPSGSGLAYSTFLGGNGDDVGFDIVVDGSGNFYATGISCSPNYPIVLGSFDDTNVGCDAFVTKINPAGTGLIYSTFLGGSGSSSYDYGFGIVLDTSGNAYVTGVTESSDFPTTPGAFDTTINGSAGNDDAYVTKLNATGSALVYSTFLGGAGYDAGYNIAVNSSGEAYVAGLTGSNNYPTTVGAFQDTDIGGWDGFVTNLNATGSALSYSTYLGGIASDFADGLALNGNGDPYITGSTSSSSFPSTPGAFDAAQTAGSSDVFVTKLGVLPQGCTCFQPYTITTAANGANSVFAADLDSDGDTDVLSASNQDDKIAWYRNDGNENFTSITITTGADSASSVFAADVDTDGDMDVRSASRNDDKIAWYRNDGNENFTAITISLNADEPSAVYAIDLDDDGDMDVLSASFADDKIAWYENNGNEVFTAQTITTAANGAIAVSVADVDGDGDRDVLSASALDNKIAWYRNNGNEVFTAITITTTAAYANGVSTADLDGDSDLDVISSSNIDYTIAWYQNDGNENFTKQIIAVNAEGAVEALPADLDADGDIDIVSASNLDNKIAWYQNTGNGSFTLQTISTGANQALGLFVADVDSDSDFDVLSASFADDKIAWYENLSASAVTNTNDSGPGSLRAAILAANTNPGLETISFSIGSGVQTIAPLSALPNITDPVIIDGTTQPGYAGTPLVVLSGVNIPSATGLNVTSDGSTVRGIVVNGFSTGNGIALAGTGNKVVGNYIGTNAAGTAAAGNAYGVLIESASNVIGGTTAAERNVISGNGIGIGVLSPGSYALIHGNYIGTNAAGTAALGNTGHGVTLLFDSDNVVGGTTAGAGNRIAFNGGAGVNVDAGAANAIRQNLIYSNGGLGIDLVNGGNNNQAKPSVNAASAGGGTTTITATLVSAPNTTYTLDFFSSPTCDPSTFGEGETYLGSKTLTTKATGRGRTIFVAGVQVPLGHVITATATSPGNDTSEFSKCMTVT